jgi:large subunit ribosomal protein L10
MTGLFCGQPPQKRPHERGGETRVERSEKETLIKELNEKFARAKTAIVAEFSRLNVETVTRLRKKFREGGVDYKVLKNTLARLAAKGTPVEVVSEDFTGPVAIAIGYDDVVTPAKILSEFVKDLETIKIRSAVVEGKKTNAAGVAALAKLPGLSELRARILGLLTQPATKLVRTVGEPGSSLARVLQSRAEALGKQN